MSERKRTKASRSSLEDATVSAHVNASTEMLANPAAHSDALSSLPRALDTKRVHEQAPEDMVPNDAALDRSPVSKHIEVDTDLVALDPKSMRSSPEETTAHDEKDANDSDSAGPNAAGISPTPAISNYDPHKHVADEGALIPHAPSIPSAQASPKGEWPGVEDEVISGGLMKVAIDSCPAEGAPWDTAPSATQAVPPTASQSASAAPARTSDPDADASKDSMKVSQGGVSPPSQAETECASVQVQAPGGLDDMDKRKRALEEEPIGERGDEDELISGKLMKVVIDSNASSTASSIDLKSVNRGKIDVTVSQTPPSSNAAKVNAVSIGADVASSTSKPLPMSSAHIASLPEDIESRKRGLESSEDGSRGKVDEMNGKLMKVVIDSSASSALSDLQLSSNCEAGLPASSSSSSQPVSAIPSKDRLSLLQPGNDDADSRKRTFGSDAPTSPGEAEDHAVAAGKQKRVEDNRSVTIAPERSPNEISKAMGSQTAEKNVLIKLLCPAQIAGSLIGPGGRIIRSVIDTSGARVVISAPTEFYPETQDRIVSVLGITTSVKKAVQDIATRICMAVEKNEAVTPSVQLDNFGCLVTVQTAPSPSAFRMHLVRLLIPNGFSKVLIGRSGGNVKLICDMSGCRIQLAEPTSELYGTSERIVSVSASNIDKLIVGIQLIADALFSDSVYGVYTIQGHSYQGSRAPSLFSSALNARPPITAPHFGDSSKSQHSPSPPGKIARSMPYSFGRSDAPIAPVPADWRTSHWPGSAVTPIHGGNYGEQVYMSPYGTMPFVANEAVPAPAPSVLPAAPVIMLAPPLVPPPSSAAAALGHGGPGHASSSIAAMALSHGVTVDAPRISDRGLTSIRLGVPECYIGAVLGRGGAVLKELIASTQCTIQISKKDSYIEGTMNRSVDILGLHHQVLSAQSAIMSRIVADITHKHGLAPKP